MAFSITKSYTPSSGQISDATAYNTDVSALFNTINGLQDQTTTIGGLTITPSSNGTTKFLIQNAAGTELFSADTTNSAVKIKAAGKIYLDGGSNTYIHEASADNAEILAGGDISMTFLSGNDCCLEATGKLGFDAGIAGTYLTESADDVFDIYVGGANIIKITEDTADKIEINAADLELDATQKLYLDGGGNTYITEGSADTIDVYAGGTKIASFNNNGNFQGGATADFILTSGRKIFFDGGVSTNVAIANASMGAGSTTLYIGNASITVSSDKRLKKDIEDTKINALEMINKFRVVDFIWDDPSDIAPVNRNSRGRWTGVLAQEAVDIAPWIINAPDRDCPVCKAGEKCDKHDSYWQIEYQNFVPALIKAIQEMSTRITNLEAK